MLEHNRNGNRMLKTIPIRSTFCFPVKWSLGLIDFWQKILSSGKQWILSDYNNFLPQWLNNVRNVFNKMDLYIFVSMWIMQRHILTKIVLELVKIFFMHEEKFSFFFCVFWWNRTIPQSLVFKYLYFTFYFFYCIRNSQLLSPLTFSCMINGKL